MVFRKDFFMTIIYFEENNQQATKTQAKLPSMQSVKNIETTLGGHHQITSMQNPFYLIFSRGDIEGRFWAQCSQKLKYMQRMDI